MIQNDTIVSKRPELGTRSIHTFFNVYNQLDLKTGSYSESDIHAFRHAMDLQSSYMLHKGSKMAVTLGHDISAYYYRHREFQKCISNGLERGCDGFLEAKFDAIIFYI